MKDCLALTFIFILVLPNTLLRAQDALTMLVGCILNIRDTVYYYPNGKKACSFKINEKNWNAIYELWWPNGEPYSYKTVLVTSMNMDGTVAEAVNNEKFVEWYINGQMKEEGTMAGSNRIGFSNSWYSNGQKKQECIQSFRANKAVLCTSWYKNGILKDKGSYSDYDLSYKTRLWVEWDSTGIRHEGTYSPPGTKRHGSWKS